MTKIAYTILELFASDAIQLFFLITSLILCVITFIVALMTRDTIVAVSIAAAAGVCVLIAAISWIVETKFVNKSQNSMTYYPVLLQPEPQSPPRP